MRSSRQRPKKTTTALAIAAAGLAVLVGGALAQDETQNSPKTARNSTELINVVVADGLITVRARDAVTADILDELARQSGLQVVSDFDLVERTSVDIDRQSLPEALRLILRRQSFALQHVPPASDAGQSKEMRTSTLWILHAQVNSDLRRKRDPQPMLADMGSGIETHEIALNHPDFGVRLDAVIGLAEIGGDEVVAPLSFALADAHEEVRLEAISALGGVGTEQAATALAAALKDENSEVQQEAVWALADIGGSTSIRLLEETLGYANKDLREGAIDSLADIGGGESARALGVALQDEDPSIRGAAVDALGEIGSESAVGLLRQALADGDPVIRSAAADILEELSEPGAVSQ